MYVVGRLDTSLFRETLNVGVIGAWGITEEALHLAPRAELRLSDYVSAAAGANLWYSWKPGHRLGPAGPRRRQGQRIRATRRALLNPGYGAIMQGAPLQAVTSITPGRLSSAGMKVPEMVTMLGVAGSITTMASGPLHQAGLFPTRRPTPCQLHRFHDERGQVGHSVHVSSGRLKEKVPSAPAV